jgi:peroxiredoxin
MIEEMRVSKRVATMAAGIVLACAILSSGCSRGCVKASTKGDVNRKAAPDFTLKDASGQKVHLSDYKGKVVLLDFWATWCGPCKIEIPWFMEFEKQFKDQGFAVVGVSMDEDGWKAIKPYVQDLKMNYRILLGDDQVANTYGHVEGVSGLDSLPTTLLIDREGNIASVHIGVTSGKEEFKNAIVQLLDTPCISGPVAARRSLGLLARANVR